jgi:hypothetical protein
MSYWLRMIWGQLNRLFCTPRRNVDRSRLMGMYLSQPGSVRIGTETYVSISWGGIYLATLGAILLV